MYHLTLLGPIDLRAPDGRSLGSVLAQPKRFALLAYLAAAKPRGFHAREALTAVFWPELPDERARANLRKTLHHLRKALSDEVLEIRESGDVRLSPEGMTCDLWDLEAALEAGSNEILPLYPARLLPAFHINDGDAFSRWLERAGDELHRRVLAGAWELAARDDDEALEAARWILTHEPTHERAARRVMALLDARGDRAGALAAYDRLERHLAEEWGSEPSPETQALREEVLERHTLAASPATAAAAPPTAPVTPGVAPRPDAGHPPHADTGRPTPVNPRRPAGPWWTRPATLVAGGIVTVLGLAAAWVTRNPSADPPSPMRVSAAVVSGSREADALIFVRKAVDQMYGDLASTSDPTATAGMFLDSALAYAPYLVDALAWRGVYYMGMAMSGVAGATDSAVAYGRRAVAADSTRSISHMALGVSRLVAGAPPERVLEALVAAARWPVEDYRKDFGHAIRMAYRHWGRFDRAGLWARWHEIRGVEEKTRPDQAPWLAWLAGDAAAAERGFRRLMTLDPARPDPRVRLAQVYLTTGRVGEARALAASFPRALGREAPADLQALVGVFADDCPAVVAALEEHPDVVHPSRDAIVYTSGVRLTTFYGYCLLRVGAREEGQRHLALSEAFDREQLAGGQNAGSHDMYDLARVLAVSGDRTGALDALQAAVEDGWPYANTYMGINDPLLASLREDPRFYTLMEEARLRMESQIRFFNENQEPVTLASLVRLAEADLAKARKGIPPPQW